MFEYSCAAVNLRTAKERETERKRKKEREEKDGKRE